MRKYAITYKQENEERVFVVELPSTANEVTLLQWSRYRSIPVPEALQNRDADAPMSTQDWFTFMGYAQKVLGVFGVPDEVIPGIEYTDDVTGHDGIFAMFVQTMGILTNYEPKERDEFRHRGVRYCFPETVRQSFEQFLVGGKMTVGQATDALQLEHVLSAKDDKGGDVMEDQGYHKDTAIIAALSRKVLPGGVIEEWPLDFIERRKILDERIDAFQDLPMDIALDGCFFLSDLKLKLLVTLSSAWRLRASLLTRLSQVQ